MTIFTQTVVFVRVSNTQVRIKLEKDIKEENHYGVPMSVVLYKQADGSVIPHDYIAECDPPLNGFSVIDNPYLKSSLDIAKEILTNIVEKNLSVTKCRLHQPFRSQCGIRNDRR